MKTGNGSNPLDYIHANQGPQRVLELLRHLQVRAQEHGVHFHFSANTPYINTIPAQRQPAFPGSREIERRIKSIIRWNAMAMVVRANREIQASAGISPRLLPAPHFTRWGSTTFFAPNRQSILATSFFSRAMPHPVFMRGLFWRGASMKGSCPVSAGNCSPAADCRLIPIPISCPEFWQFPTVSMGLSPIMAIYQARFNRYMQDRGIKRPDDRKVWAFLGDGELDEPESLGAITLAARERPRQSHFRGQLQPATSGRAGSRQRQDHSGTRGRFSRGRMERRQGDLGRRLGPLLAQDENGMLVKRMEEVPDGQYQMYSVAGGDYIRKDFFGKYPELEHMVRNLQRRAAAKIASGRARPPQGVCRLSCGGQPQGFAHGDIGQNHQGVWPG